MKRPLKIRINLMKINPNCQYYYQLSRQIFNLSALFFIFASEIKLF